MALRSLRRVSPSRLLRFGSHANAVGASGWTPRESGREGGSTKGMPFGASHVGSTSQDRFFQLSLPITADTNYAAKELYNRHRRIMYLNGKEPDVAVDAWIAPNATLIGDVVVEDRSTVWYGCVLRGDLNSIRIASYSNVLERTCIHAARSSPTGLSAETNIGKFVTIGANSSIRSATIEDEVVIGHRCVIMEGSIVETHAVIQDGTVVPPGRRIPAGQVWSGCPAKFVRNVTYDEIAEIKKIAEKIQQTALEHAEEFLPYSTAYIEAEKLKEAISKLSTS